MDASVYRFLNCVRMPFLVNRVLMVSCTSAREKRTSCVMAGHCGTYNVRSGSTRTIQHVEREPTDDDA
jgi:hypothetical protein